MKIAIFGGVGSGKSTVLDILRNKYRARVYEADELAHVLYRRGQPGYKAIRRICGKDALDARGEIDRGRLAELLFADADMLKRVNRAIHAMVWAKTIELMDANEKRHPGGLTVIEAALLPENEELLEYFDSIWYVYTDKKVRTERLMRDRGYSSEKVAAVMAAQPTDEQYRRAADIVIDNSRDIGLLEADIDEAVNHCQRQQRQFNICR